MKYYKIIIFGLCFVNVYFITHIFTGNNNIFNFFKAKKEIEILKQKKFDLIKQRHQLETIYNLLEKNDTEDSKDALEEILRRTTQSTLPNEKIILLDNNDT